MKLKKMLKKVDKMRKNGTLPNIGISVVKSPFGDMKIVSWPLMTADTKKENIKEAPDDVYKEKYAISSKFSVYVPATQMIQLNENAVVIDGLTTREAVELKSYLINTILNP